MTETLNKLDEQALAEASAKLRRLRLTDVGGRKEHPADTVKSVLERGLGGLYDDAAVEYILRHGIRYYIAARPTEGDAALRAVVDAGAELECAFKAEVDESSDAASAFLWRYEALRRFFRALALARAAGMVEE